MNKVVANARAALEAAGIKDGASIMMGGFGLCILLMLILAGPLEQVQQY